MATLLAGPYAGARKAAENLETRKSKKNDDAAAMTDAAEATPDGAMFGSPTQRRPSGRLLKPDAPTGLRRVFSQYGKTGRRNRRIAWIGADAEPKSFTARNIVGATPVTDPEALIWSRDERIGGSRRDMLEAAFRLSLRLDPGAANPVLEAEPKILTLRAADPAPQREESVGLARDLKAAFGAEIDQPELRVTMLRTEGEVSLAAIALVKPRLAFLLGAGDRPWDQGAAIAAMRLEEGGETLSWLRPALSGDRAVMLDDDRSRLRAGLADLRKAELPAPLADALEALLNDPWNEMAARCLMT